MHVKKKEQKKEKKGRRLFRTRQCQLGGNGSKKRERNRENKEYLRVHLDSEEEDCKKDQALLELPNHGAEDDVFS